jgi:hypothetical protein
MLLGIFSRFLKKSTARWRIYDSMIIKIAVMTADLKYRRRTNAAARIPTVGMYFFVDSIIFFSEVPFI